MLLTDTCPAPVRTRVSMPRTVPTLTSPSPTWKGWGSPTACAGGGARRASHRHVDRALDPAAHLDVASAAHIEIDVEHCGYPDSHAYGRRAGVSARPRADHHVALAVRRALHRLGGERAAAHRADLHDVGLHVRADLERSEATAADAQRCARLRLQLHTRAERARTAAWDGASGDAAEAEHRVPWREKCLTL